MFLRQRFIRDSKDRIVKRRDIRGFSLQSGDSVRASRSVKSMQGCCLWHLTGSAGFQRHLLHTGHRTIMAKGETYADITKGINKDSLIEGRDVVTSSLAKFEEKT